MYGIITNKDGSSYTSYVFGYFCSVTAEDEYQRYIEGIYNRYYLVLNEEKTALVKKYVFDSEKHILNPLVLITDSDNTEWIMKDECCSCVSFLNEAYKDEQESEICGELLKKCIDIDSRYIYDDYPEIKNQKNIDDLLYLSGWFHDAFVTKQEIKADGTLYVLFDGIWGCKLEVWFNGDVSYNIENDELYDVFWTEASLFIENGSIYLIEGEDMEASYINKNEDNVCWFKAQKMKYHVIPNDPSGRVSVYPL